MITLKQYKAQVSTLARSLTTNRDKIQNLVLVGGQYYSESEDNNPLYLTILVNALIDVKTVNSGAVKDYIRAIAPNLSWTKNKNGEYIFKHKKGSDSLVDLSIVDNQTWYEFKSNAKSQADWDLNKYLNTVAKTLEKHGYKLSHIEASPKDDIADNIRPALQTSVA